MTVNCIQSIVNETVISDYEIIVVDNNSKDDSEKLITTKFPQVRFVNTGYNSGFGRANNAGMNLARGEYILLLNSDTLILDNAIDKCLNAFKLDKNKIVVGAQLLNEDYSVQKSTYSYINEYSGILKNSIILSYFFNFNPKKVRALMGAFVMFKRELFVETRGFDPDFFMYAEEMELFHRFNKLGYKIEQVKNAKVLHYGKGSSQSDSNWSLSQNLLSNSLLFLKTNGYVGYFFYHVTFCFVQFVNLIVIWKMNASQREYYLKFNKAYWSNFFSYIKIPFQYSKNWGSNDKFLKK